MLLASMANSVSQIKGGCRSAYGERMSGSQHPPERPSAQPVVVGFDGSDAAERAVTWAARHASSESRPLLIAYAVPMIEPDVTGWASDAGSFVRVDEQLLSDGEALVSAAAKRVTESCPDLEVGTVAEHADPREMLLRLSNDATVVVTGSRGRGRFRSLVLGSVAAAVAGRAACPVVVVPADDTHPAGG